ncbi:MAG: alanine--tRNA ligase [Rickettsiales bacterium]|nr:alanine--tRNA ligase [Rickettsiales bacterium]
MKRVSEIRSAFLDYFAQNDHKIVKSAPLLPENDPSLLFVNAGMVPFKQYFTGELNSKFSRIATSQKCIRAGGKHNDLENVGYTARHHTFFEMLGNFSFGDYFKEQSIFYAWDFVTKELGLDPNKLLVTVFHTDKEAIDLWRKISGLADDRILKINSNDNFWSMGDVGPCGPCSEIFYDHGSHIPGNKPGQGDEGDRFVEIWNLVFMQYQTLKNGEKIALPKQCIDTGMGLERVASIMQGKNNNYDIDLFQDIINESIKLTGNNDPKMIASHRVISDHLRSSSFLIADGVLASNEGRGYILRRIIRRAIRHVNKLGGNDNILAQLAPVLIDRMGKHFDELIAAKDLIINELALEEEKFAVTLDKGIKILNSEIENTTKHNFSGEVAFKLYDTYGFPLDLTQDILREKNIKVDIKAFDLLMQEQKIRAKANWKGSGDVSSEEFFADLANKLPATEFKGYENITHDAKVLAIIKANNIVSNAEINEEVVVIFDKTPFYAESGGQVGDTGTAISDKCKLEIKDCQKQVGNLFVHFAKVVSGVLEVDEIVSLNINSNRRKQIKANHSATHLLHFALKQIIGAHVAQKGSFVSDDLLRFDFAHNKSLSADQIINVENFVNNIIWQNVKTTTEIMPIDQAKAKGAVAMFGEKYDDVVRVVSFPENSDNSKNSIELCGGTHVNYSGDIGLFKITSEGSVASGIRRIEAVTQAPAFSKVRDAYNDLQSISQKFQIDKDKIAEKIDALMKDKKQLIKSISKYKISEFKQKALKNLSKINGLECVVFRTNDLDVPDCRDLVSQILKSDAEIVVLFNVSLDQKVNIIVAKDQKNSEFNAGNFIREVTPLVDGKGGGGKDNFAQGGGTNIDKIDQAINSVKDLLAK